MTRESRTAGRNGYERLERLWFRLRAVERIGEPDGGELRQRRLASHLLLIPLGGRGRLSVNGRYAAFRFGDALIGAPGQLVSLVPESREEEQRCCLLWFETGEYDRLGRSEAEAGAEPCGEPDGARFPRGREDAAVCGALRARAMRANLPALGKRRAAEPLKANNAILDVSMELLPEYAADRIFLSAEDDADTQSKLKQLTDSALWKDLPAVKNNHVYILDKRWSNYDATTMSWELDDAVRLLSGNP